MALGVAMMLLTSRSPATAQEPRTREESIQLAAKTAAAGDLAGAREILVAALGPDALALPDARGPRITQSLLRVENAAGRRALALELMDSAGGASASALAREAAASVGSQAPVIIDGSTLTITLSYTDATDLLAAQARIAAALPDLPELALLHAALSTRHLAWPVTESMLSLESGYQERVDLSAAARVWELEAAKLDAAAFQAATAGGELDQARAAIWRGDAQLWRDLAGLSRAVYRARVDEQSAGPEWLVVRAQQFYQEGELERVWSIRPGETRQLEASILGWRYDRLALAAAGAVALVLVIFIGLALAVR